MFDVTFLQWHCAVDATGKTYYYKKEGGETVWELPEVKYSLIPFIFSSGVENIYNRVYQ